MPHGPGLHAHVQIGETMIMIPDEQPAREGMMLVAAPESLGGTTTILEMYVDDVDRVYKQAVDAGGKPMMPVDDAFYGDRTGWVADPFGHIWAISTVKEELTSDQVHDRMVGRVQEAVGAELARLCPEGSSHEEIHQQPASHPMIQTVIANMKATNRPHPGGVDRIRQEARAKREKERRAWLKSDHKPGTHAAVARRAAVLGDARFVQVREVRVRVRCRRRAAPDSSRAGELRLAALVAIVRHD